MEVILTVEHLRKYFSADPVLVDVSFQLRVGDKVGLVGPNGCGKTTLLNILAGREESEKGTIDKASGTSIGYLEQRHETASNRTVLEEAKLALAPLIEMQHEAEYLADQLAQTTDETELIRLSARYDRIHESLQHHDAYHFDYRIEKILHGVGFTDDEFAKPVSTLSGGEMNRLNLAQLLLEEPDVMLLDEPSNHLDLLATEWLENFLHDTSASVILVSHDRYFLDRVTNRTLELFHGTIDDYPGNFSKYSALKEERLTVQTRTYEKYIEEVEKAKDFIRRNHYGMKAAQAEDRRKKLERLMETPASSPRKIESPPMHFSKPSRTGDIVFRCEKLSKSFTSGKPLFQDLTFDIERGQRWAILGPNGCGKTTLLRCLLNEITPDSGKSVYGQGLNIGYFDQQLHVLDDSLQVLDAIRPVNKKIFEEPARRNLLGSFGLTGDQQLQKVVSLSGGQRCRAALAKLSAEDANVLILDEPTNHLDLWARAALEKAIRDFEGTVLFISHDRYFVDRVADHLLIIQPDARFKILEGNYSTFRHMVSKGLMADPFLTNAFSDRKAAGGVGKSMVSVIKQNPNRDNKEQNLWKANSQSKEIEQKKIDKKTAQPLSNKKHKEPLRKEEHWKNQQGKTGETVPLGNTDSLNATKTKKEKKVRKFPFRKIHEIEEEIFARETQIMAWNEDLLRPEIARDGERTKAIHHEIKEEQDKIALLYEHWEEASELNW
ncbi:MAG: ABC-F family ATP-binding cassette domain-containing protein [Planctomycetaceae bacterium]|jgi:ATP-binding cassette subfamily F protein 3|nr:ABC-F family ATP-binding cassette domain-containing protein [Planctomycetaceae bacterium]